MGQGTKFLADCKGRAFTQVWAAAHRKVAILKASRACAITPKGVPYAKRKQPQNKQAVLAFYCESGQRVSAGKLLSQYKQYTPARIRAGVYIIVYY